MTDDSDINDSTTANENSGDYFDLDTFDFDDYVEVNNDGIRFYDNLSNTVDFFNQGTTRPNINTLNNFFESDVTTPSEFVSKMIKVQLQNFCSGLDMKTEAGRLATFSFNPDENFLEVLENWYLAKDNSNTSELFKVHADLYRWPLEDETLPRIELLANAGFYYSGPSDNVVCFKCKGHLSSWESGDVPATEHKRHFQTRCGFVQGKHCGNVQIDQRKAHPFHPSMPDESQIELLERTYDISCPVHPQFENLEARIASFENWPHRSMNSFPLIEILAEAGFYHVPEPNGQHSDLAICYYCNARLHNWEQGDCPWLEHVRNHQPCNFILRKRGPNYVTWVRTVYLAEVTENYIIPSVRHYYRSGIQSATTTVVDKTQKWSEISEDFDNYDVLKGAVMLLGEDRKDELIDTIRTQLFENDRIFKNSGELLQFLINLESNTLRTETIPKPRIQPAQKLESFIIENLESESQDKLIEKINDLQIEIACKICLNYRADVVFYPCSHLASCSQCAEKVQDCPICRGKITKASKIYLA